MRWCRPRSPVDPMYMPGRLRTASRPSRTWIALASYLPSSTAVPLLVSSATYGFLFTWSRSGMTTHEWSPLAVAPQLGRPLLSLPARARKARVPLRAWGDPRRKRALSGPSTARESGFRGADRSLYVGAAVRAAQP